MDKLSDFFSGDGKPQEEESKTPPQSENEDGSIHIGSPNDFVSDSLVQFFAQAKETLEDTEASLRQHLKSPGRPSNINTQSPGKRSIVPNPQTVEDAQDRALKKDMLDRLSQKDFFSPHGDLLATPPPNNPAADVTLSQAKRMVFSKEKSKEKPDSLQHAFEAETGHSSKGTAAGIKPEQLMSVTTEQNEPQSVLRMEPQRDTTEARRNLDEADKEQARNRVLEKQRAKQEAEKRAAAAKKEASRKRAEAEEARKQALEKQQAKLEAERRAAEAATRQDTSRKRAETEDARKDDLDKQQAKPEAERRAAEVAAEKEASRKSAEAKKATKLAPEKQPAKMDAERGAAEEQAIRQCAEVEKAKKLTLEKQQAECDAQAATAGQAKLEEAEQRRAAVDQAKLREEEEMKAAAAYVAEAKSLLVEQSLDPKECVPPNDDAFLPNQSKTSRPRVSQQKVEASNRASTRRRPVSTKTTAQKPVAPSTSRLSLSSSRANVRASAPPASKTSIRLMQGAASIKPRLKASRTDLAAPKPSSRLVHGTASITARTNTKSSSPTASKQSSRLMQGTASSLARTSPPGKAPGMAHQKKRDPKVGEESLSRAKERARRQKLAHKNAGATTKSSDTNEKKLQEARARAKERVRQHKLCLQKGSEKENIAKTHREQQRVAARERKRDVARATTTVARSPPLSTRTIHGSKIYSASGQRNPRPSALDENPITRASGSPTHGYNIPKGSVCRSKPRLTVPKAPRLSTLAKYGDKPPPTVNARKSEAVAEKLPSHHDLHRTVPKPFHFHETKSPKEQRPTAEPTLAEQMDLVTRKGFRDISTPTAPVRRDGKLTIPKTPKLSESHKRALPKSTAAKEEEEMEYYRSHPFRAQPVKLDNHYGKRNAPKVPKRRLTMPEPFHLRSDERATHAKPPAGTPDKEAEDLKECKKQFHARSMPNFKLHPKSKLSTSVPQRKTTVTTPKPFHLSTEPRKPQSSDDVEMPKQFRARRLPRSTFVGPPKRPVATPISTPPGAFVRPPKLATSERTNRRQAATEASRKKAQAMTDEKKKMALRRQREKHSEDIAKSMESTIKSPEALTPFHLESERRHEVYIASMEEHRRREELETKRLTNFHARPFHSSPPPQVKQKHHHTEPEPFHLESVTRHEQFQRDLETRLEEEAKNTPRFKARPVPKTTYRSVQPTKLRKPELVIPISPDLQSKHRSQQRQEYNATAEQERQEEAARKKAIEDRLEAEETADIEEKRRLPASDGGFMPNVEPINAVFHKMGHEKAD